MTTEHTSTDQAAQPLGVGSSEGLGLAPEREAHERAYNAGFVEASRMHGAEIERLRAALAKANEQAERFERGWYLRGDALESIKKHCEPQPSALAAAIVATCDSGLKA